LLLAVYHDLDDEHREHMKSQGVDPADYVDADDLGLLLGDDFTIECPTGSGVFMTIDQVAAELAKRLTRIFLKNSEGERPVNALYPRFQRDENFRDYVPFYEYFDGDTARGVGASHQTGWTGIVAKMLLPRAGYQLPRN